MGIGLRSFPDPGEREGGDIPTVAGIGIQAAQVRFTEYSAFRAQHPEPPQQTRFGSPVLPASIAGRFLSWCSDAKAMESARRCIARWIGKVFRQKRGEGVIGRCTRDVGKLARAYCGLVTSE